MKRCLIALLCLVSLPLMATEVYMSRDAKGNVVFSDQPSKDAEKHQVKDIQLMPAFSVPAVTQQAEKVEEPVFSYTSLSIVTPQNGYHLEVGYAGNIGISGVLSPGLRETDTIVLLDSGSVIRKGRQTSFQLTNLDRGEHQLQMVVRDSKGTTLISSNPVTLYVQRASSLNRSRKAP